MHLTFMNFVSCQKIGKRGKWDLNRVDVQIPPNKTVGINPDPLTCEQKTNARPAQTSSPEACCGANFAFCFPDLSSVDQPRSRISQHITHRLGPIFSTCKSANEIRRPADVFCGCFCDKLFLRRIFVFAALYPPPQPPHAPKPTPSPPLYTIV